MPDQPQQEPEKKTVDEDWKEQVQAENDVADEPDAPAQEAPQESAPADVPLPPPSLELLCTTLATQAMMSMGMIPHPMTGEQNVHVEQAKHLIDTLEMLQEKTQGNRTAEETVSLNNMLHQLRMGFVAMQQGDAS